MPQKNRTVKGVLGGLLGLVGLSAVAGLLVTATVTPVLAMTGLAGSQALTLFDELPSNLDPSAPMEQSTFYATGLDGAPFKLASVFEQNRVPVTYEQVAPVMFEAVLSSEDKSFYSHGGVNLGATVKAIVDNVKGTSSRGASTISQQFVKNVLIQECEQDVDTNDDNYSEKLQQCWTDATNATGSKGIERKLQEMRFAIQIEKDYSKNDILLGYLNIANFGGTVYGIEAAASYYFSTTAANLTLAQAATLAGMVQNPNYYRIDLPGGTATENDVAVNSAEDGYAKTKERRDYVLERMLTDGKITQAQYEEADASDIVPAILEPQQGCVAAGRNAYFCEYVKSIVLDDPAFGATPQERSDLLRRGGLEIYTSLDLRIQDPAAESMANIAPANFDNQFFGAAGVSVEATTGRVLAITQNTTFSETILDDQAYSSLVFANDKRHGGVPVGSTYKLFTLIDWLEKGHSLRESINGSNRMFTKMHCGDSPIPMTSKIGNYGGGNGGNGTPMSFTAQSLNSGYLAMAEKLDLCEINKVADRMGVTLGNGGKVTEENFIYDILGSKYISPMAMAGAYATVANGGIYCTPKAIDRVVQNGKELPLPASSCTQVISPEVAATAAYALQNVMTNGTGTGANPYDGTPVLGKTGTHETYSTMMIESSTNVTSAIWVGRSKGDARIDNQSTDDYALSSMRYALARDMQSAANAVYSGNDFPGPDENLLRQVLTNVPNVVGKTIDEATAILEDQGFSVSVGAPVDSDKPTNIVAAQDPAGQAPSGGTVTLSPSNAQGVTMPDVTGQSKGAAQSALIGAGFTTISFNKTCNPPEAVVKATSPAAGTATKKSTPVSVACE